MTEPYVIDLKTSQQATGVVISYLVLDRPFPSDDLLNVSDKFSKGQWGFLNEGSEAGQKFHHLVLEELNRLLKESFEREYAIIVLPEFSSGPILTKKIRDCIVQSKAHGVYVVAGTYYDEREGKVASICPIITPDGKLYEQYKFVPAPKHETKFGCDPHPDKPLLVFKNTGFGNFAVAICSDALLTRTEKSRRLLRQEVEILVVPARNPSSQLPNQLRALATNEGIVIAYCNGLKTRRKNGGSCVYMPLKKPWRLVDSRSVYLIDIGKIRELYQDHPGTSQRDDDFKKRQTKSPINFHKRPNVLAIGSHFDDIWLGCAATLMLLEEEYGAEVICADLCDNYQYRYFDSIWIDHSIHLQIERLCRVLGFGYYHERDLNEDKLLRDRDFPDCLAALSSRIKSLATRYAGTDVVFIPRRDDYHQDHALTATEVLKQFRHCTILEYEVKEFRRGPFHPNLLFDVTRKSRRDLTWNNDEICKANSISFAEKKASILDRIFPRMLQGREPSDGRSDTIKLPNTFSREHVLGRLAIRASEFGLDTNYAEAFCTDLIVR